MDSTSRLNCPILMATFWSLPPRMSPEVNAEVYQGALERSILCNSVDDIPNCDFFFGSVVSRGDLQIAISTAGESPAVAQRLRREIDEQLPEDLGPWLGKPGTTAPRSSRHSSPRRGAQARCCTNWRSGRFANRALARHANWRLRSGRIRAGKTRRLKRGEFRWSARAPATPICSPSRPLRLIQTADVILHDDLVPRAILDLGRFPRRS